MALHREWRDCQAWRDDSLELSTTSNEACKMYDAYVTQMIGFYNDESVGGMQNTLAAMKQADPTFIMSYVIENAMEAISKKNITVQQHPEFKEKIDDMMALADKSNITDRERCHVNAVKFLSEGDMEKACGEYETILLHHPTDMLAIRILAFVYLYMGWGNQMRDVMARVLPLWKPHMPNYGYLMGMYAFGLQETNLYDAAEKIAFKGLQINPSDVFSTHSLSHVYEMTGRHQEGITFLEKTQHDWQKCCTFVPHILWHKSLFHIERGEYEEAFTIYDNELKTTYKKALGINSVTDGAAVLLRMEMNGIDVGERWQTMYSEMIPYIESTTTSSYVNPFFILTCNRTNKTEMTRQIMENITDYIKEGDGFYHKIMLEVGQPLVEAFNSYCQEDYATAVDLLYPVRYSIHKVGRSNAQRDIFHQLLISAAMKSPKEEHHIIASRLLVERKALKEDSPLTDRFMAQIVNIL